MSHFQKNTKITTTIIYSSKNLYISNINILYYDEIDIFKGTDINKTSKSKVCDICHYWYFLEGLPFYPDSCNGCHDEFMMSIKVVHTFKPKLKKKRKKKKSALTKFHIFQ